MKTKRSVEAKDLNLGDRIFFPNSRHSQVIDAISENNGGTSYTVCSAQAKMICRPDFKVVREEEQEIARDG